MIDLAITLLIWLAVPTVFAVVCLWLMPSVACAFRWWFDLWDRWCNPTR